MQLCTKIVHLQACKVHSLLSAIVRALPEDKRQLLMACHNVSRLPSSFIVCSVKVVYEIYVQGEVEKILTQSIDARRYVSKPKEGNLKLILKLRRFVA